MTAMADQIPAARASRSAALVPAGRPVPGMAPLATFHDVTVVPGQKVRPGTYRGGPVLPQSPDLAFTRHCRNGKPVDVPPAAPVPLPEETVDEPLIWAGAAFPHFGHFIGDHTARILQARAIHPAARVALLGLNGEGREVVPDFVWDVLSWLSVPRRDVFLIDRPLRVRTLHIAAQSEQLGAIGPTRDYLDLVDANQAAQQLVPISNDFCFVTRAGLGDDGSGRHAGEGYLVRCLENLGVTVIAPERLPLRRQLAYYAGAQRLCFAEGSALHGRQLLGRIDQRLTVLCRRPGHRHLHEIIAPRVADMDHAQVSAGVLNVISRVPPATLHAKALAIYDEARLLSTFAREGIDLRGVWTARDYAAARDADIRQWLSIWLARPTIDRPATRDAVAAGLEGMGLGDILSHLDPGDPKGAA